jgi:membrane protein DedA with SNARE-associated domain/membrane-associated phospholipid phosphatase
MGALINFLIHWVTLHPHLTGLFVGIIACAEALAFVGMLVPGAVLMFAAGALIGVGAVGFWSVFAWAVGGAILGDGLSYWLGYRYKNQIRTWGPIRRHAEWLSRGESFFHMHGGKSVVFARFVGPVRPLLPVIAGMLNMPAKRFYLYNILSAFAWAAFHLLIGMGVGASLVVAGQVATRLVLLVSLLVISIWGILWFARVVQRLTQPHLNQWANQLLAWSRRHPRLGWFTTELLDPERSPGPALISWFILLAASIWLFLGTLEDVVTRDQIVYAGQSVYQLLQSVRVPTFDSIMIVFTELGDATVVGALILAVLAWLAWHRAWRDAAYWITAVVSGEAMVAIIKFVLKMPRPIALYNGADAYSFPSGHSTFSVVVYGFLAVLVSPVFGKRWRWLPYASAGILVSGIAFSRLYLGAHWLADVAAGLALGMVWVALLAITRERRATHLAIRYRFVIMILVVFSVVGSWHIFHRFDQDAERYAPQHPVVKLSAKSWWNKDWQSLPAWRIDLSGELEQPLNIQWAGNLDSIQDYLRSQGWHKPTPLDFQSAISWFTPNPALNTLPILPKLNKGRYETLLLVRPIKDNSKNEKQLVLRLWPADVELLPSSTPLWIGTIAFLKMQHLPLISFPRQTHEYEVPRLVVNGLPRSRWKIVDRTNSNGGHDEHQGNKVLLIH